MAVKKNARGVWYFKVNVEMLDENGRLVKKSVKRENKNWLKKDAEKAERDFLNNHNPKSSINSMTYGNLFLEYLKKYRLRSKLNTIYELETTHNKHILPTFNDILLKDITVHSIELFQERLKNSQYANATIENIQLKLFQVLRYANNQGYINIKYPPYVRKDEIKKGFRLIEKEEYIKLRDNLPIEWSIVFSMLYFTGMRKGELVALTFNDIDLDNNTITINKTYLPRFKINTSPKTKRSNRVLLIPNILKTEIIKYYDYLKNAKLDKDDRFIVVYTSNSNFTFNKNNFIKKLDLRHFKFHDFRHTHCSYLIDLGFNAFEIAERLGDTVTMVNEIYGHLFKNAQKNMMNKLDDNF